MSKVLSETSGNSDDSQQSRNNKSDLTNATASASSSSKITPKIFGDKLENKKLDVDLFYHFGGSWIENKNTNIHSDIVQSNFIKFSPSYKIYKTRGRNRRSNKVSGNNLSPGK